jgi:hypothetical protein
MSPMAAIPPPREGGSDQQPAEGNSSWRTTIDGWVKDARIRRDALFVVGMLLVTAIAIVWIIFQASALASVLSTTVGKLIVGSIPVGIATGASLKRLQRRRHHRHSAPPIVEALHGSGPLVTDAGAPGWPVELAAHELVRPGTTLSVPTAGARPSGGRRDE